MRAVNLIPAAQRGGGSAVGESQGIAYAILGILGGLAVLVFLYGNARHQISSRRKQAATLTAQAQRAQAQAGALAPYVSFAALREQRKQAVSQLVNSRFDWSHAFHEVGRVLPWGVSLSSLDGTIGSTTTTGAAPAPGVAAAASASATPAAATSSATAAGAGAVSSATPPGSVPSFTISGCAISQAEVAVMLTRLRLIDGVSEVTLQSSTKGASSGAGAGSSAGNCGTGAPVFTAQIVFQALPLQTGTSAAKGSSVASSTGASASSVPATTPGAVR